MRERGSVPCLYVRGVLDSQVDSIDQRIRELEDLRRQLKELLVEADSLPETDGTCRLVDHVRAGRSRTGSAG